MQIYAYKVLSLLLYCKTALILNMLGLGSEIIQQVGGLCDPPLQADFSGSVRRTAGTSYRNPLLSPHPVCFVGEDIAPCCVEHRNRIRHWCAGVNLSNGTNTCCMEDVRGEPYWVVIAYVVPWAARDTDKFTGGDVATHSILWVHPQTSVSHLVTEYSSSSHLISQSDVHTDSEERGRSVLTHELTECWSATVGVHTFCWCDLFTITTRSLSTCRCTQ